MFKNLNRTIKKKGNNYFQPAKCLRKNFGKNLRLNGMP